MDNWSQLLIIVALSVVGVIADVCIKSASNSKAGLMSPSFIAGAIVYLLLSMGWFYVFKHVKLSVVGILYPLCTVMLLTAASVLWFGERLTMREGLGVVFGALTIVLLFRFT